MKIFNLNIYQILFIKKDMKYKKFQIKLNKHKILKRDKW